MKCNISDRKGLERQNIYGLVSCDRFQYQNIVLMREILGWEAKVQRTTAPRQVLP